MKPCSGQHTSMFANKESTECLCFQPHHFFDFLLSCSRKVLRAVSLCPSMNNHFMPHSVNSFNSCSPLNMSFKTCQINSLSKYISNGNGFQIIGRCEDFSGHVSCDISLDVQSKKLAEEEEEEKNGSGLVSEEEDDRQDILLSPATDTLGRKRVSWGIELCGWWDNEECYSVH